MKRWKVVIQKDNINKEIEVEAISYADAYIKAGTLYPGYDIKSVTEIRK